MPGKLVSRMSERECYTLKETHTIKIASQELCEKKIGCAPVLNENKNVATIIRAFKSLHDDESQLHIFGEGVLEKNLKADSHGNRIYFHGQVAHRQLLKELAKMDCMIIASHREAGPYVALEAMAIGLPLLSTKVGAMEERLGTDYGYWFDADDDQQLAALMNSAMQLTEDKVNEWSQKLNARYMSNYSSDQIEKQYLEAIHRILDQ